MPSLPPPRVTELYYDGTWHDISGDMRESTPVTLTRGVSAEGSRSEPGTATALLDNRSGDYSPRDPNSALHDKIGRNTPWRIGVQAGTPWLDLPGAAGDALVTPDHAALAVLGDLDVRVDVALDDWRRPQLFAARYNTVGEDRSWGLILEGTGKLIFLWSPDGTVAARKWVTSTVAVAVPEWHAQRLTVRAVLDINNGSAGSTVTFYTARPGHPWQQLGVPVVTAGTTSVHDGIAPLEIGDSTWLQTLPAGTAMYSLAGTVYGLQLRDGATLKVDLAFGAASDGATTVTDTTGLTWTATGAAVLSNLHTRMVGEVPAWPPSRDLSGADRTVAIAPAGIMRRLDAGNRPLDSAIRRYMLGSAALECWPLTDGQQATEGAALFGSAPVLAAGEEAQPLWGQGEVADWIEPVIECPDQTFGTLVAVPRPGGTASWAVDFIRTGPGLAEGLEIFDSGRGTDTDPRTKWQLLFQAVPNQILVFRQTQAGDTSSTAFLGTIAAPGIFDSARPHHIRFATASASSTTWSVWIDGVEVGSGTQAFRGKSIGRIDLLWDLEGSEAQELALGYLTCWNAGGPSAATVTQAVMGFPGETAGARVLRLSAETGVPVTVSGAAASQTRLGIQRPERYLDSLATVAKADMGYLVERRDALELAYRARVTLYNQAPVITLVYTDGVISEPFRPLDDDKLSENDVTVKRDGGTTARAVLETGRMSVQDPPSGISRYDRDYTLSLESDSQPPEHAQWRMHVGTFDGLRYTKITLDLGNPRVYAMIDDIYRADVGDLMRLTGLPADHGPGPVDLIIRGYTETIGADGWKITFNCTPGAPWSVGVADDPVLGRADTDGSELAGAVSATDTVLPVTVTAGPAWVTAAPNVLPDPAFDAGTGAWTCTRGTSIGVVSWEKDVVHSGTGALRVTRVHPTDAGTMNLHESVTPYPAAAGQTWTGTAYVFSGGTATNSMRPALVWRDAAGADTFIYGSAPSVGPGAWTLLTVTATLPAGAVGVRLNVEGRSAWTVGEWWVLDDAQLAPTDLLDGQEVNLPDQFPFDVSLGGEQVTVHSIGSAGAPLVSDTFTRPVTPPTVTDTFGRTVATGWGSANTGQVWSNSGGSASDYAVSSGVGTASAGVVNSSRFTQLATVALADVDMQADVTVPVVATGASISSGLRLRAASTSTYYYVEVVRATSGDISLLLVSRVSGSSTTIAAPVSKGLYTAGETWTVRARLVGSVLQAKLWATAGAEPASWDVQAFTTSIPAAGPVGTRTILSGGNTNPLPVVASWDNIRVTAVASGWGTSTSGHTWARSGGSATEYTTDGGRGLIALTSVDSSRRIITGPALADTDVRAAMTVPVVAATDSIDMAVMSRYQNSATYYLAVLHCHADATIDVRIRRVVSGVYTTLSISSLLAGTYAAGDTYWLRFQTTGSELRARGWRSGTAEPATWQATATDTSITAAGQTGIRGNLQVANTNALPVIIGVDQFDVAGPQQPFRVTRSVNGIAKGHPAGTAVSLTHPMRAAL